VNFDYFEKNSTPSIESRAECTGDARDSECAVVQKPSREVPYKHSSAKGREQQIAFVLSLPERPRMCGDRDFSPSGAP
jgi:hypothetical protein